MPKVIARMSITKLPISSPRLHAKRKPCRPASGGTARVPPAGRSLRVDHPDRHDHRDERRDVDPIRPAQAEHRDDRPAQRRADDAGQLPQAVVERDRRPQPRVVDQVGQDRGPAGPVDRRAAGRDPGQQEQQPRPAASRAPRRRPGRRTSTASPPATRAAAAGGRRRSASVPPISDTQTSGISSASPIRPTISDERVSTYTWKGSATSVTCVPRPETKPPSTSSR